MPSGPANRTRRQLPGAAAVASAPVCSLPGAVGDSDQHLTARQQLCEEPRKRACTLRSHTRDAGEGRNAELAEKDERPAPAQLSTSAALSGGKHNQQQDDQRSRQVQQQLLGLRATRLSRADSGTKLEGGQLVPRKRQDSCASTATLSTTDAKESVADEAPAENKSPAVPAPTTTPETSAPSGSGARPENVSSRCAPTAAAARKGDEEACPKTEREGEEHPKESASKEAAGAKLNAGRGESLASSAVPSEVPSAATQPAHGEKEVPEYCPDQGTSAKTGERAWEERRKNSAAVSFAEAYSLKDTEPVDKAQPTPDTTSRRTTSPPLQDDIQRGDSHGTTDSFAGWGARQKTSATELQGKRDSLSGTANDTLDRDTVLAVSTREDSPLHQQASPEDSASSFEDSLHGWPRKATIASDSSSSSGQRSPAQEQSAMKGTHQSAQDPDNVFQAQRTLFELPALPQKLQMNQVVHEEHVSREGQLQLLEEELRGDEERRLMHRPQKAVQRLEESLEPPPKRPSSPGQQEGQQSYTSGVNETGKQLVGVSQSTGGRLGEAQQDCRSEDVRFFLRIGEDAAGPPRSVHVSRAFLKDSWRAQRFLCKLFGVDIAEVIGLVDEQGFVSPFDGEELFIRNGGTYTLELTRVRTGEYAASSGRNTCASAIPSARRADESAQYDERAVVGASGDRAAHFTRTEPTAAAAGGSRAAWQQAFATEYGQLGKDSMAIPTSESGGNMRFPPTRASSALFGQAAQQGALCREEHATNVIDRAAGKRGTYDLVSGQQQQNQMLQSVLRAPSSQMRCVPADEQQTRRPSGTGASTCDSIMVRKAHKEVHPYRVEDEDANMRNRKDVLSWDTITSGPRGEPVEKISASDGACHGVVRGVVHSRSMRESADLARMPGITAQGAKKSEPTAAIYGGDGRRGEGVEQQKVSDPYRQSRGQTVSGLQECGEVRGGAFGLPCVRKGGENGRPTELLSREESRMSAADRSVVAPGPQPARRVKQRCGSLSPPPRARNGGSAPLTEEERFATEELEAKRSKLEDGCLTSASQQLSEGQYSNSSGTGCLPEHALTKKQQQSRRGSKLWISAPLLVWRRRRLRRSLTLHEPEDPAEVATRQLVAEQHVRAVLARVSQRKALRSHLQIGADGAQDVERCDSDSNRPMRKGSGSEELPASRTQQRGSTKGMIVPRPPKRSSALNCESLLMDSLLWKKASTEKIYVHQTSSYGSATYTVREGSAHHAELRGNVTRVDSLPSLGDRQRSQLQGQQYQRQWRDAEGPHGAATRMASTYDEEAILGDEKMDMEEERTGQFMNGARDCPGGGAPRQYMLRPRHHASTQAKPEIYLEKKVPASAGDDDSSLQHRRVQPGGGAAGEDKDISDENSSLRPALAREQQGGSPSQAFPARCLNNSSTTTEAGRGRPASGTRIPAEGGAPASTRSRTEKTGFQASATRADGSVLPGARGSIGRGCTETRAYAGPEDSGRASDGGGEMETGGLLEGCEWKKQVGETQNQDQQHILQQVLNKQLFTTAELQRLLTVLETLKMPKQQEQQQHTLVDRLKVLLPPQTFNNLKLLLPTLLKTAERMTRTDVRDNKNSYQTMEDGSQTSSAASSTDINTTGRPNMGENGSKLAN